MLSEIIEKKTLLEAIRSREKDIRQLRGALKDAVGRINTDIPGYENVLAKTSYVENRVEGIGSNVHDSDG